MGIHEDLLGKVFMSEDPNPAVGPIIQSEVSQKEKHQYSILTHIYGI